MANATTSVITPSACLTEKIARPNWSRASELKLQRGTRFSFLFDRIDAQNQLSFFLFFSPTFENYCRENYANGKCDTWCNNVECNWDGLDCEGQLPPNLATGIISVIVLMDMQTFRSDVRPFLREVRFFFKRNGKAELSAMKDVLF